MHLPMYLSIIQKHLYHSYIQILILPSIAPGSSNAPAGHPPRRRGPRRHLPRLPRLSRRRFREALEGRGGALQRGAWGIRPVQPAETTWGSKVGWRMMEDGAYLYFLNKQTYTCIYIYYTLYIYIYILLLIIVISIYIYIYILYYLVISCFTVNLGWLKIKSGQIGGGLSTLACYEKLGLVRWTCGLA